VILGLLIILEAWVDGSFSYRCIPGVEKHYGEIHPKEYAIRLTGYAFSRFCEINVNK
jgi:hypothetical protein